MSTPDLSWMQEPAVVKFDDNLLLPADKAVGHHALEADKIFEHLEYLPARPRDGGRYLFVGLAYPIIRIPCSLFEIYHSEVGINPQPYCSITKRPLLEIAGAQFHRNAESHRLIWLSDAVLGKKCIEFLISYVFVDHVTKKTWGLWPVDLTVAYPDDSPVNRPIPCTYLMPYNETGGFICTAVPGLMLQTPEFSWREGSIHSGVTELQAQRKVLWPSS